MGARLPPSGETVSASRDDTARIGDGSSINDDLDLAPLEEHKEGTRDASTSSSGLHDERPRRKTAQTSASSIEELQLERYGSGPLDALLDDPTFEKRVQMPKTQLSTRKPKSSWESSWIIIVGLAGLALVIGVILLSMLAQ